MKSKAIAYPYVGWMALFVVAPILIITVYAFTSSDWSFTTENFRDMTLYSTAFGRSFLLAAVATVICLLIGYPLAYLAVPAGAQRAHQPVFRFLRPGALPDDRHPGGHRAGHGL